LFVQYVKFCKYESADSVTTENFGINRIIPSSSWRFHTNSLF
jgi:hypothetical protein